MDKKNSPNYELKAQVLNTDICKQLKEIDRKTYLNNKEGIVYDQELENKNFDLIMKYGHEKVKEGRKINLAGARKTKRLRKKIERYLTSGACLWVTLTFTNKTLENTTEETRKQYVRKYLKSNYQDYIANIDYGSKREREHYHAVIKTDFINLQAWHTYGAIKVEHIRVNEDSIKRLPKYINKLTNHAVKETCRRCHIIYSRRVQS